MNYSSIFLFVFLLYWFFVKYLDGRGTLDKYNITAYGPILMIRTQRGQKFLDKLAVHKTFWRIFASIGLPLMLIGMLTMLLLTLLPLIISLRTQTLPSPSRFTEPQNILLIPGVNEFIPLAWGIVGLIVTLVVHEFSHAILCKVEGIKVKSMGILLALIPIGGFAEPDEEQLLGKKEERDVEKGSTPEQNQPKKLASRGERVRILTAGVMANFVTALFAFALFFLVLGSLSPAGEVMVANVVPGYPADLAGVKPNMVLTGINDKQVNNPEDFMAYAINLKAGSDVTLNLFDRGEKKELKLITTSSNDTRSGVVIDNIAEGSPAGNAGIKAGMIIVRIDDTEIKGFEDFVVFMNSTHAGQKVNVYSMSKSSSNASPEIFENVELAKHEDAEKGYLGVYYSRDEATIYSMGLGVGQFPAKDFLHGLKNIPSLLTHPAGWGYLLGLPFFDIEGERFPRFKIDLLTYFYEPSGWAVPLGTGIFIILNILLWIGWTNLIAGLFNCLPAVPLDGGHVFRDVMTSFLTKLIGNGKKVERLSDTIVLLIALLVLVSIVFMIFGPQVSQWFS